MEGDLLRSVRRVEHAWRQCLDGTCDQFHPGRLRCRAPVHVHVGRCTVMVLHTSIWYDLVAPAPAVVPALHVLGRVPVGSLALAAGFPRRHLRGHGGVAARVRRGGPGGEPGLHGEGRDLLDHVGQRYLDAGEAALEGHDLLGGFPGAYGDLLNVHVKAAARAEGLDVLATPAYEGLGGAHGDHEPHPRPALLDVVLTAGDPACLLGQRAEDLHQGISHGISRWAFDSQLLQVGARVKLVATAEVQLGPRLLPDFPASAAARAEHAGRLLCGDQQLCAHKRGGGGELLMLQARLYRIEVLRPALHGCNARAGGNTWP
mmetsp:Transcript_53507/g.148352  ORF Transcript_53507/g.148352 Transcript_53507/m.148352 type:complete len:317 (+) Transcript_53507:566-1516(+)